MGLRFNARMVVVMVYLAPSTRLATVSTRWTEDQRPVQVAETFVLWQSQKAQRQTSSLQANLQDNLRTTNNGLVDSSISPVLHHLHQPLYRQRHLPQALRLPRYLRPRTALPLNSIHSGLQIPQHRTANPQGHLTISFSTPRHQKHLQQLPQQVHLPNQVILSPPIPDQQQDSVSVFLHLFRHCWPWFELPVPWTWCSGWWSINLWRLCWLSTLIAWLAWLDLSRSFYISIDTHTFDNISHAGNTKDRKAWRIAAGILARYSLSSSHSFGCESVHYSSGDSADWHILNTDVIWFILYMVFLLSDCVFCLQWQIVLQIIFQSCVVSMWNSNMLVRAVSFGSRFQSQGCKANLKHSFDSPQLQTTTAWSNIIITVVPAVQKQAFLHTTLYTLWNHLNHEQWKRISCSSLLSWHSAPWLTRFQ